MKRCRAVTALTGALAALLLSCGGNGTDFASSRFANRCAAPRPGQDVQGSLADEKNWLRLWIDELYLWYREVPNLDPAAYDTAVKYFAVLKTTAKTPSGNDKDRFHFTIPTAQWLSLSGSGVEVGYGVQWAVIAPTAPRDVRVAYIDPNTPGASAPIARGGQGLKGDGFDVTN